MNSERLFSLREEHELKQQDLANILKVNRVNISNWEKGKEIIPLSKLNIYANYFNVSLNYLVKLSDNKNNSSNIEIIDKKLVGSRLREVRKKNNLTQKELANILNTTQSTISDYENGANLILTSFAYQVCFEYNISMDWLCGRD